MKAVTLLTKSIVINRFLFKRLYKTQIAGLENAPKDEGFIWRVTTRASWIPFVGCSPDRPICYFARDTLFKKGFVNWLLHELYSIPIKRDASSDPGMKTVFKGSQARRRPSMFPEGTRSKDGTPNPKRRRTDGLQSQRDSPPGARL